MAIGVSYELFPHLTPIKLEEFLEAHEKKQKMLDQEAWKMGIYIQSAVLTAVEHVLAGRKATTKYLEEPILSKKENADDYTEEELVAYSEAFFTQLQVMATNFELSKEDN